jgi:hypothetical protein
MVDGEVKVQYECMCPSFEYQLEVLLSVVEIILKEASA